MSVQNFKIKHGLNLGDHELIDVSGNINLPAGAVINIDNQPLDALPDQTNQTGKFLSTDGSSASWNAITQYAPPTNQGGGNFLSGDGTYKQVTVPTLVSQLSNDSGYQTGAQVAASVAALVDAAPSTLNTLNELAQALGDDPNFATTVTNQISAKWDQDSAKLSQWDAAYGWGNHAAAGYANQSDTEYQLTFKAPLTYVNDNLALKAALSGATFTGTVQAPTLSSEVKAAASKQGMQWTDSSGTKLFGLSVYGTADTYSPSLVWNSGNPTANYTGGSSVVIGAWAAPSGSGFSNAIFGYGAGYGLTSGGQNTFFGANAGYSNAGTANQTTLIGTNTTPAAANQTNQTVIGYGAIGNGSNTVTIGNASITDTYLKGIIHGNGSGLTNLPSDALTGTSLASGIVSSSLTSVGTLSSLRSTGLISFGSNTFTKSSYGIGDLALDNGSNDTPALLLYYANNKNWGIDSWNNGTSNVLRFVSDLNESTGVSRASLDNTGKFTAASFAGNGSQLTGVIQVVQAVKTDVFIGTAPNNTTFTAITGLSATITPKSTSSKILIMTSINYDSTRGNSGGGFAIFRNGSRLDGAVGAANGNNYRVFGDFGANANADQSGMNRAFQVVDSPSTTSATTYDIRFTQDGNSFTTYINKARYDDSSGAQNDDGRFASSIVLMEIA